MNTTTPEFDHNNKQLNNEYKHFIGKTILGIRPLYDEEIEDYCWYKDGGAIPMIIIFTDGSALIPSMDPEGNGAGHLIQDLTMVQKPVIRNIKKETA